MSISSSMWESLPTAIPVLSMPTYVPRLAPSANWASSSSIARAARLTASVRSKGVGLPPCCMWPSTAGRTSYRLPPSAWKRCVRTSVV